MTCLPLSTALNTIDSMHWTQQGQTIFAGENVRQALDRPFRQSGQKQLQGHLYGRTGVEEIGQENDHQQSTLEDITAFMDDEYNQAFLEMYDIEQFYAVERWQKGKLTESEQLLLVEQLQSLIKDAPISSHLHPTQKILELEYYNLLKLSERIQEDREQSENVEITARIREEEHQPNNGH